MVRLAQGQLLSQNQCAVMDLLGGQLAKISCLASDAQLYVDGSQSFDHGDAQERDKSRTWPSIYCMVSVGELLSRAKAAIASGERSIHDAAEYIAAARSEGATQRTIAAKIGKSAAWVNRLLAWRDSGYIGDAAFGRAQRKRIGVQPAEHKAKSAAAGDRHTEASQGGQKQRSNVQEPNFDWAWLRDEIAHLEPKAISDAPRDVLVKMLGMLGSDHAGEVVAAARAAEKQRLKLGLTWDQLIISAAPDAEQDMAA